MANGFYKKSKKKFLDKDIDMLVDTIKVALVKVTAGYAVNLTTDEFLSTVTAGNTIATSGALQNPTTTLGVFDADNITVSTVPAGADVEALVVFMDTGDVATSPLIAYIDTVGSGLPYTPNGGDVLLTFNASGIFEI